MASKKKIEIKSPTSFAKGIKKKWLVYGGSAIFVVFLFIVFADSGNDKPQRRTNPTASFTDTTPINSNQAIVLSRIQAQLKDIKEASEAERKAAQEREAKLIKEVEAVNQKLASSKEAQEEAISKALEDYKAVIDERIAVRAEKSDMTKGGIYIPTPTNNTSGSGKTPPPPPIYVADKEQKHQEAPRSNLPQSTIQGGATKGTPMIITGSTQNGSNVLMGSTLVQKERNKASQNTFLPAGSFARATLITGADFGAGKQNQSNPQPTLMRLQTDATLPGMAKYKLKDCFAIANGYGDLSSERAYMSVSRLSCVQSGTGKVLEASVLGYIADSDGKLGMRGVLQRRSGMLLGKAMLAGFADGASKIMTTTAQNAQQAVTGSGLVTTIDPSNAGTAAGWAGMSSAMEKLADQYIKEADSIFPVIEIDAGRNLTIIFQNGQELKWNEPNSEGD